MTSPPIYLVNVLISVSVVPMFGIFSPIGSHCLSTVFIAKKSVQEEIMERQINQNFEVVCHTYHVGLTFWKLRVLFSGSDKKD